MQNSMFLKMRRAAEPGNCAGSNSRAFPRFSAIWSGRRPRYSPPAEQLPQSWRQMFENNKRTTAPFSVNQRTRCRTALAQTVQTKLGPSRLARGHTVSTFLRLTTKITPWQVEVLHRNVSAHWPTPSGPRSALHHLATANLRRIEHILLLPFSGSRTAVVGLRCPASRTALRGGLSRCPPPQSQDTGTKFNVIKCCHSKPVLHAVSPCAGRQARQETLANVDLDRFVAINRPLRHWP